MSKIKSFSVGNGDTFYIKHGSDNFTIIDCCLKDENKETIVDELKTESKNKGISRFISTHPDEDHIQKLDYLDDQLPINNFYCVSNEVTKTEETNGLKRYFELRDGPKAFNIYQNCSRKWMNQGDTERGSAGLNILWPNTSNQYYKDALKVAEDGGSPNNISPIVTYSIQDGAKYQWMGDLETDFMENIEDDVSLSKVNILFAPHHGRDSGKVPKSMLDTIDPDIIIIGEAPSGNLNYYSGYNTITQLSAGDITFVNDGDKIHIYVSKENYSVNFLKNRNKTEYDNYIGTLDI